MSKYSAGSVFYYPSFHHTQNTAQSQKFQKDLQRYLTRKIGFEAVMRIRCTKGEGAELHKLTLCHNWLIDTSINQYQQGRFFFISVFNYTFYDWSTGLSIHTFHGNFFVRSTDLLSLANVNPDSGFAVQMSIEESLADTSLACFQAALLYTSSKGNQVIFTFMLIHI